MALGLGLGFGWSLGRKGVFFTFIAFVFLALLIFSLSVGNNYEMRQRIFVIETRVDTMDKFLSDVEQDMERGAYIAGFRTLIALEDHIVSTGEYLTDLEGDFNELFFNGTLNGVNSSIMVNNTFDDWVDKIKDEADKIDILVNFSINNVNLSQDNPWDVRVNMALEISVIDKADTSQWNRERLIISRIEINGFEDPIYRLETNGVIEHRVEKTNFSYFANGADISNLLSHTYDGYYASFSGAPSYLMRLEGNFGSSEYGIESLVDVGDLNSRGVSSRDKSIVDYIYFGSQNPVKYHVSGAPSWFKLDNESNMHGNQSHHGLYEVNGLV